MSVATRPIQSTNHFTPKKGEHITIHSQRAHSHQSYHHPPNADPSRMRSSFITLPSSYLCCVLLVSWLVLVMSPVPQQSPIQCFQTLDQRKLKPLHTTSTEIASLPDMFDQRMFTSFLQQTALLVTNHRDNKHDRQFASTTIPQDHCFFDTAKQERTSNASTHTTRFRWLSDATSRIEPHKQISRGATAASSTRLWCLQMLKHDNTSPSPINPSNNTRQQQLTLARSSPLHAVHIQKPRHTPRILRGIHSFDICLETSGTHKHETALIKHSPSYTTTPFRSNWTPLPHCISSHHLPPQRLSSSIQYHPRTLRESSTFNASHIDPS